MGQNTRNPAGPTDRLTATTEDMDNTLARRIMACGECIVKACSMHGTSNPEVLGTVNGLIVDCMADCIDILRGDASDAGVNNR